MITIDEKVIKCIYKSRSSDGYKGDYGHTLVVSGSLGYVGSAYFTAMGAVRTGSGLVSLGTNENILDIMSTKLNEVMVFSLEDSEKLKFILEKVDCIVFGPGIGTDRKIHDILKDILLNINLPIVIDADGLSILSKELNILKNRTAPTVLTPHYGEFSRLTDTPVDILKKSRAEYANKFAKENGIILLLKDHRTLITDSLETYINTTGNSAMANGGMGDVLAGMIGSFISQGYSPLEGAILSSYIHGLAGDILSREMFVVNPTDILNILPYIIKKYVCNKNS